MISARFALTIAGALTLGAWLARTEMGAHVRSAPPHETLHTVFSSVATLLEGRMPKSDAHLDFSERLAEFRPDEPLRRLAASIGMLVIETSTATQRWTYRCTAAVIAQQQVITNHHCIETVSGEKIDRITLWLDYIDGNNVTLIEVDPAAVEQDKALDYAILTLKQAVNSNAYVLPKLVFRAALPGERLLLVHHSRGDVKAVTRFRCRVATESNLGPDKLAHSCSATSGSSGSLLLAERDHAIVGLHRSSVKEPKPYVGYATPAMTLLAKSPALQRLSRQSVR
jgi:hypothetical protein